MKISKSLVSALLPLVFAIPAAATSLKKCPNTNLRKSLLAFPLNGKLEINFTSDPTDGRKNVQLRPLDSSEMLAQKEALKNYGINVISDSVLGDDGNLFSLNLLMAENAKTCELFALNVGVGGMRSYKVLHADANQIVTLGDDLFNKPVIFTKITEE